MLLKESGILQGMKELCFMEEMVLCRSKPAGQSCQCCFLLLLSSADEAHRETHTTEHCRADQRSVL